MPAGLKPADDAQDSPGRIRRWVARGLREIVPPLAMILWVHGAYVVLRLLLGVRRVDGLDAVEADVAAEALDQVAHLDRVLHVPVGMGDDGDAA